MAEDGLLTNALAPEVESEVRNRGDQYFKQARVQDPKVTPERFDASVRGKGGTYAVTLDLAADSERQRSVITANCSCPFFTEGRGCCKHIWAVLCHNDGMQESTFKVPSGWMVNFKTRIAPIPTIARKPLITSADPNAAGRIRGISSVGERSALTITKEPQRPHPPRSTPNNQNQTSWRDVLKLVGHEQREIMDAQQRTASPSFSTDVRYVVDIYATRRTGQLTMQIFRHNNAQGEGGKSFLTPAPVDPRALAAIGDNADREILTWFFGVAASTTVRSGSWDDGAATPMRPGGHSFVVADSLRLTLLKRMATTGRLGWFNIDESKLDVTQPIDAASFRPFLWDDGDPWTFRLAVTVRKDAAWIVRGEFYRGRFTVPLGDTLIAFPEGVMMFKERIVRIDMPDPRVCGWIRTLHTTGTTKVEKADQAAFLRNLVGMPNAPYLLLPSDAGWSIVTGTPRPKLVFLSMPGMEAPPVLTANYDFDYEMPDKIPVRESRRERDGRRRRGGRPEQKAEGSASEESPEGSEDGQPPQGEDGGDNGAPKQPRVVLQRDRERELGLIKKLCERPGVQPSAGRGIAGADVFIDPSMLTTLIGDLGTEGWVIEAEGKRVRTGRSFSVDVKSGVDWLDLRARFDFGDGTTVELPKILEAMRRGDDRIQLSDGTIGMLPDNWRKRLEPILGMGEGDGGDGLRYRASHAAFLDVLVSEAAEARLDESFAAYRQKLATFSGIQACEPHESFVGELRPYQKQGVGWLEFLDEFAFGGCLADDMGLGKTVQLLAYLQKRRRAAKKKRQKLAPTLITAPTSLIHNWVGEAAKFTPDLKILAHHGASRARDVDDLQGTDIVVTSYGTMRSDIEMLAGMTFDYVVLDEAQAIKNEATQIAKAARALKANRRLAMSGTPVENRLAELGSIFRFLNPGMLDGATTFTELFSGAGRLTPGKLETLARVLKPFILRRTKEQVLPDLPGKTENVVYCVLDEDQKREYDELAAHYRDSLKNHIKKVGIGKSHMQVLEALLRLRQLSCHPGLIDEKRVGEPSAKLDLLLEQLEEALDSGRKALVFSQFTSMLAIVRKRLEEKGLVYEYLDGSTRDRQERVERFQTDDACRVFLISLKAGGTGLNLTAADYCFIIDPWWNPASEAQAIDRAHRIGQQSHVFAYRLIARGTVEEKILDLQAAKKKLVEGIIGDEGNVLGEMTAKDLDFLLE